MVPPLVTASRWAPAGASDAPPTPEDSPPAADAPRGACWESLARVARDDLEPLKHDLKKKICIGAVSHRSLQADRPEDVAAAIAFLDYLKGDKARGIIASFGYGTE